MRKRQILAKPDTKVRLLRSAEELFVAHGIDAVSMREINRHAGQRNASSLHYHFKSLINLLEALIDWRMPPVDQRRVTLMQSYAMAPQDERLQRLAEAVVLPLAETIAETGPPNLWVRLHARIYQTDSFDFAVTFHAKAYDRGLLLVRKAMRQLHPDAPRLSLDQRLMLAVRLAVYALADWQRGVLPRQSLVAVDDFEVFLGNLLGMIGAALTAPLPPPSMDVADAAVSAPPAPTKRSAGSAASRRCQQGATKG